MDQERVQLVHRRTGVSPDLGHERHVALGRIDTVDDQIARRRHGHEIADPLDDSLEVGALGEGPGAERLETVALAAPEAERAGGRAHQDDADARGGRDACGQRGKARIDPLDRQRIRRVEEVHERVRPRGDDPNAVVLSGRAGAAEHPREVTLEVVHEPLEEPGRSLRPQHLQAPGEDAAPVLGRRRRSRPVGLEEVFEE